MREEARRTEVFSPRMRGCSYYSPGQMSTKIVFPAYAGMFLRRFASSSRVPCFPRVCGDVPHCVTTIGINIEFSPRMRGCSGNHWMRR